VLSVALASHHLAHARRLRRQRVPAGLWVAVALLLGSNEAGAAALGSLASSAGLFAALAAWFVIKGWPAQLPIIAWPAAASMLLVAAGAAWLWRARAAQGIVARFAPPARSLGARRTGPVLARPSAAPVTLPEGIGHETLLAEMRLQFVRLQAAWDVGDLEVLGALTTPQMLDELRLERSGCAAPHESIRTDVVTLHAELLGFEEVAGTYLVSVDFSGLIRESSDRGAAPFRELWMLAQSKQGGVGWRLARHQALL
jgi:predicted lipid-binding transport protein (Tim44 family)